jgi:3-phenylpropionate/cinnamic acid dioxygenase small subunit
MDRMADHLAIEALIHLYTDAGDRAKFDEFISVFAEDAEYVTPLWWTSGRARIRAAMIRAELSFFGPSPPSFMRHHLTTCRIGLTDPDEATARTYFINYSDIGADHAGVYVDRFRRINGEWLIIRREDRVDWQAETSLYVPGLPALSRTPLASRNLFAESSV